MHSVLSLSDCSSSAGSGVRRSCGFGLLVFLFVGCYTCPVIDSGTEIVHEVASRTTEQTPLPQDHPGGAIPEVLNLADGMSEAEAVGVALWNNPDFQVALGNLGLARADLIQAGLLTNPDLMLLFPIGPKIFEATALIPLEALLLRPYREDIAHSDYQRIATGLVQIGLDLVRNVRQAYVELRFANDRAYLAVQAVELRKSILDLSQKRLDAGDVSELQVINARTEYLTASALAENLKQNVLIARNNLFRLMGIASSDINPGLTPAIDRSLVQPDADVLVTEALAIRPDAKAARLAIQNAQERLDLAGKAWIRFWGVIDINSPGRKGFEIGPGLNVTLPIFDWNQAGVQRAHARLEQTKRELAVVEQQITLEVRNSLAQLEQARDNVTVLQNEILPALQEAVTLAEKAFQKGGETYLFVLQVSTQYLDARVRELELLRDRRRARAELERSVGHRLTGQLAIEHLPEPHTP